MSERNCRMCEYWKAQWGRKGDGIPDHAPGYCQRHAPALVGNCSHDRRTAWPETAAADGCGDWCHFTPPSEVSR